MFTLLNFVNENEGVCRSKVQFVGKIGLSSSLTWPRFINPWKKGRQSLAIHCLQNVTPEFCKTLSKLTFFLDRHVQIQLGLLQVCPSCWPGPKEFQVPRVFDQRHVYACWTKIRNKLHDYNCKFFLFSLSVQTWFYYSIEQFISLFVRHFWIKYK